MQSESYESERKIKFSASNGQSMITNKFSVAVMVSDERVAANWYKQKLGFDVSVSEGWTTAWPKGASSKLHLCKGELEPGNTGIGLFCDDIKKTAEELKKKGVKFTQEVKKEEWGTTAMIADPDGNELWLLEGSP
jgi:predicted enzyme related to lactoylglutathione lyase